MKSYRLRCAMALFVGMVMATPALAVPENSNTPKPASAAAHTPAKGSAERAAILDTLRAVVKKMSDLDVIFVVTHLKLKNNWAWVVAEPQSRDGTQHYETMIGLLQNKNGKWIFVEGPPEAVLCDEDPECADTARYFRKLAKKYPSVSMDIFPK